MPRMKYPSISDIASQVLRDVAAEDRVKTAEAAVLHGTDTVSEDLRTRRDIGDVDAELRKLATLLRAKVAEDKQRKFIKCAQIVRGHVGLAILRKKLGRSS